MDLSRDYKVRTKAAGCQAVHLNVRYGSQQWIVGVELAVAANHAEESRLPFIYVFLTVAIALNKSVDLLLYALSRSMPVPFRATLLYDRKGKGAHGLPGIFELAPWAVSKPGPKVLLVVGEALDTAVRGTAPLFCCITDGSTSPRLSIS